jgi:hypothetical protein
MRNEGADAASPDRPRKAAVLPGAGPGAGEVWRAVRLTIRRETMRQRIYLVLLVSLFIASVATGTGPKYAVRTFYNFPKVDQATLDNFHLNQEYIDTWHIRNMEPALNAMAQGVSSCLRQVMGGRSRKERAASVSVPGSRKSSSGTVFLVPATPG